MSEQNFWVAQAVWSWPYEAEFQIVFISSRRKDAEVDVERLKSDPCCVHVADTIERLPMRAIMEKLKGEAAAALGSEILGLIQKGRE